MPLRNRVRPDGSIVAVAARGELFGNRGVLHDDAGSLVREWQVRRWIVCRLRFKGRRRALLQPRRYTELFFLDEPTALAAGHRPCAECRRDAYRAFQDAWRAGQQGGDTDTRCQQGRIADLPRADEIDRVLHAERRAPRTQRARPGELPDGVVVDHADAWWLLRDGALHPWRPEGYGSPVPAAGVGPVLVMTPPSTVAALAHGYVPLTHPSAVDPGAAPPTLDP